MTATDELREGLRKRGESWHKWPDEESTTWQAYSNPHTATESMDGTLIVTGLTPAQAIAATLGAGTCHVETTESWLPAERYHRCKNCGAFFAVLDASGDIPPRVCPNCGRRVV